MPIARADWRKRDTRTCRNFTCWLEQTLCLLEFVARTNTKPSLAVSTERRVESEEYGRKQAGGSVTLPAAGSSEPPQAGARAEERSAGNRSRTWETDVTIRAWAQVFAPVLHPVSRTDTVFI